MKNAYALIAVVMVAGCAGELDTSSQGGGDAQVAAALASGDAVSYVGTITATMSADGFDSITESTVLTVVVSGDQVFLSAEGETVQTSLNGNAFSVTFPISGNNDGVSCVGNATVAGVIDGNKVSGTVLGAGKCNEASTGDVAVNVEGSIAASA